jgi:flavin-dependent dehydrogenase
MLLARRGYRVLLVERDAFPRDTFRNHYVLRRGVACLRRWGLLERVAATGCPAVRRHTVDLGDFPLAGHPPPGPAGADAEYAPRRRVLDPLLASAAGDAGAELRERFTVDDLLWDGDRVAGVVGRTPRGGRVAERARFVVGADGLRSVVAARAGAREYDARPALTCGYYTYWADLPLEGIDACFRYAPDAADDRWVSIAFPTNDGLTCAAVQWPIDQFRRVRADLEGSYLAVLRRVPAFADRLAGARRAERLYGTAELPFFLRTPAGPGWALVGDAGYHKDPIHAQGISDAFEHAEFLSEALDGALSGRAPFDAALGEYGRRRDEHARPKYAAAWNAASFAPPPPEHYALRAALRHSQTDTDQFYGVGVGAVPRETFYAPDNLARIVRHAHSG